jgi:hypothetical protein
MHDLHVEIDHDWKGAGYCGPYTACDTNTLVAQTAAYKSLIDVQGFVFWNPDHLNESDHNFSGWELHPLTAWRLSDTSSDFGLSASPNPLAVMTGQLAQSTITVNTFNLFTGNVSFTTTISATPNSTGPMPTAAMTPAFTFIAPGAIGNSTLTVATEPSSAGNYTVLVIGTDGTLVRMISLTVFVVDFSISANPSLMSISIGSTGQSTLSLGGINGFSGNVALTTTVNPASLTADISPSPPVASLSSSVTTLSPGFTGSITLTISASLLTTPGTYTVVVTATSGGVSHTATVAVTVTVAGFL